MPTLVHELKEVWKKAPSSQRWWFKFTHHPLFAPLLLFEDGNNDDDDHA